MIDLPPTARLALALLKLTPGRTFAQLFAVAGCRNERTLRDALRLLHAAGLVTKTATLPATYNVAINSVEVA